MTPSDLFADRMDRLEGILTRHDLHLLSSGDEMDIPGGRCAGDPFDMRAASCDGPSLAGDTLTWGVTRLDGEGDPIAMATVNETLFEDGSYALHLDRIFVAPEHRGLGVARDVARALIDVWEDMRPLAAPHASLSCEAASDGGQALLDRFTRHVSGNSSPEP